MKHCTQAEGTPSLRLEPLHTICGGCGAEVIVDVGSRIAEATGGRRGTITYADTDIAVWDCPACQYSNADELR